MLAIICAMQREAEVIISRLEGKYTAPDGVFSMGRLKGQPVAVAVSAPGKVNAAIAATLMTLETMQHMLKIDTVLNLGVAGGLVEEYRQGDVVLPFAFVQYDIDTTSVGDPPGFVSGVGAERFIASGKIMALKTALTLKLPAAARVYIADLCATADRFLGTREQKQAVRDRWKASICDMEAGAIAQVCSITGVPFLSVKVVSDTLNGDAQEYEDALDSAAVLLADIAEVAAELSKSERW